MGEIAYLSIGSNQGDRLKNISKSIRLINDDIGEIIKVSSIYENPPIGFDAEMNFYNLCIAVETNYTPQVILTKLKNIELLIGRTVKSVNGIYSSRCIDIDIVLIGTLIFKTELLSIPHIEFRNRSFVLTPLFEIASSIIDPETGKPISFLLDNCKDKSELIQLDFKVELK